MDYLELFSISLEDRGVYYRVRLAEHTPPVNAYDKKMIGVYQRLLDINNSVAGSLTAKRVSDFHRPLSRKKFIRWSSMYMVMGNLF